jgi:undecaprenyl-diphosphatase
MAVIGWATLGFGVLLYAADRLGGTGRRLGAMNLPQALVIGLSQILALIPGTSRSGITMTAARMLGFDRSDAARFSLLLSIPTILGAGVLKGKELYETGNAQLTADAYTAAGLALVSALVAIWAMMQWLRRSTFTPFVIYRIILGLVLLVFAYGVNG